MTFPKRAHSWGRIAQKYGSKRLTHDGYSFASKLEAALYDQLKLEMLAKEWETLECQVQVHLTDAAILYKPDFRTKKVGVDEWVYHEAKGFETPEWRIKRRLWIKYGPGELRIYMGSASRFQLHETIIPKTGSNK